MMKRLTRPWILVALVLIGCSVGDDLLQNDIVCENPLENPEQISDYDKCLRDYHARSRVLSNIWIGRNATELVHYMGRPPDMVLDTNASGTVAPAARHMDIFLYFPGEADKFKCLHAYVVLHRTGEIVQYYCR